MTVELEQLHGAGHLIGRFRLAVTTAASPLKMQSPILLAKLSDLFAITPAWRTDAQKALSRHAMPGSSDWSANSPRCPNPSGVYCGSVPVIKSGGGTRPMLPRTVHVLNRGDVNRPGEIAEAGAVAAVPGLPSRFKLADPNNEGQRRAALADWLSRPENPLTWRVIVNRVGTTTLAREWSIRRTICAMGGVPSHPELLDWLAVDFRDNGGSLKKLHRLIVTSSTYRQTVRHDPSATAKDADNRWLWRMNRTRLDAETMRDSVLLLSGRLDETMYGPPVQHFISKPGVHVTPEADYDKFDVDTPRPGDGVCTGTSSEPAPIRSSNASIAPMRRNRLRFDPLRLEPCRHWCSGTTSLRFGMPSTWPRWL